MSAKTDSALMGVGVHRLVRKFRRGQKVSVDFIDGFADENWTGLGKFIRHVKPDEPGLEYLNEPSAIVKTSDDDCGSVFPLRCISFPNAEAIHGEKGSTP